MPMHSYVVYCIGILPYWCISSNLRHMAYTCHFEGHICFWHIFAVVLSINTTVYKFLMGVCRQWYLSICREATIEVQWAYMSKVTDIFLQWHMPIMCSWSYYLLQWLHMKFIYWHGSLISAYEVVVMCGIYVVFEGHIYCWHIYGIRMFIEGCNLLFFGLVCCRNVRSVCRLQY